MSFVRLLLLVSSFPLLSLHASTVDWPAYRGATGQGVSQAINPPLDWSTTRNIVWKTEIPGRGWSSPLLINNKIMCYGKRPSKNNIRKWLEDTGYSKSQGGIMDKPELFKNITFSEPHHLAELVAYEEGRVVSRTFAQNPSLSLTLFSFDAGEGVKP